MNKIAIILTSHQGVQLARLLSREMDAQSVIVSTHAIDGVTRVDKLSQWVESHIGGYSSVVVIGAVGIAVRLMAPCVKDKYSDPAVVALDLSGTYAVSVLSGHVGGANELTSRVAHIVGATPIITTRSDTEGMWALDTLDQKFGWSVATDGGSMNNAISAFVNREPTALIVEVRDRGTEYMERTKGEHVDIYYSAAEVDFAKYKLVIGVTPRLFDTRGVLTLTYRPKVLHVGVGCRKDCDPQGVARHIEERLREERLAAESVASVSSIELKRDEPLLQQLSHHFDVPINIYQSSELAHISVPNPSAKVMEVTGVGSVAEATSIMSAGGGVLLLEKQKGAESEGNDFTFAVAHHRAAQRRGHIEFVGAGPGDPDLISVRGRQMLESADLILYAGSLVPVALTHCAKDGATVRSSASMNLEEQFAIMKEFYDRGLFVVRLHTGDPCIYGAIQEQMSLMDQHNMSYHITPGISSFQAAAAALESQFTIPEKVQSIILTRGEGRTPVPEKERLNLLARSQSTMCIFLSATVVESVQRDLLEHYPPTTPVAACYKLTWPDERIYRGELQNLAQIVKENNLTLTTMIVVGDAIDNRKGLSRLYADEFKHIFRR